MLLRHDQLFDQARPRLEGIEHGVQTKSGRRHSNKHRRVSKQQHNEQRLRDPLHQSPRYQLRRSGPMLAAAAAPSARNVPKGNAYFIVPRPVTIRPMPITDPERDASSSVMTVSFQPTNAPIIDSILTSPMPRPSSWRSK